MAHFDQGRLLKLTDAALAAGLHTKRGVMLGSLPAAFRASLPEERTPVDQLKSDLQQLNDAGPLADGTVPMATWLEMAVHSSQALNRHQPFEAALADLRNDASAARDHAESRRSQEAPPSGRRSSGPSPQAERGAPNTAYTYFLAHASADKPLARELHRKLGEAGVSCFLDEVDVQLGDDWDQAIPKAHQQTAATLVMVSARYDKAYYLRDEVHTALKWARQEEKAHRVVPIFVDGVPDPMPYGLTVKQGLDLATLGLEELVQKLVALARSLGAGPATPLPRTLPPTRDRAQLFEALCKLQQGTNYFDQILMFDLPQAADQVPKMNTSTPADRALALVQWAALQDADVLEKLWQAVARRAPGTLR